MKKKLLKDTYQIVLPSCVCGFLVANYILSTRIEEIPHGWPLYAVLCMLSIGWVLVGYRFKEYELLDNTEKENAENQLAAQEE